MRRILLTLSLFAATAGFARAETIQPQDSVAVKVAGMTPQAARVALRAAVRKVCRASDANDINAPTDCYNTTLHVALDNLKKAERASGLGGEAQTAAR